MSAGAALQHRLQLQTAAQLSKFQKFMWWNIIFLQNMQFNISISKMFIILPVISKMFIIVPCDDVFELPPQ